MHGSRDARLVAALQRLENLFVFVEGSRCMPFVGQGAEPGLYRVRRPGPFQGCLGAAQRGVWSRPRRSLRLDGPALDRVPFPAMTPAASFRTAALVRVDE